MDDFVYIDQFEKATLEPFHHADHVRVAFAYLCRYPALQALEKFSASLKNFAAARGKDNLYNETITWAFMLLVRERMARGGSESWEQFSQQNPDLLVWKGGIIDRYYTSETLGSELARRVFVFPDKSLRG